MSQVLHKTTLGRASRTLGQLWQVPTFLVGLFTFVLVAVSAPLRQDPSIREFDDDLNRLRQAINQKREKAHPHLPLAESLLDRAGRFPHKAGEVHYLAGTLYQRLANEIPPEQINATREKAMLHLEAALTQGVPDPDLPNLQYRLGSLLFSQGHDLRRVIQLMARSIELQPLDQRGPGYGMLVQAYLKLPQPLIDAALEANLKQIDLLEEEEALIQAWLLRGELLYKREQRQEAYKWLDRINAKASRQYRVPARLLQIKCCEEEGLWKKAVPLWQELMPEATQVMGGKGRILYSLGMCHYHIEPADYEAARKTWLEAKSLGADEGQAASFRLAELLLFGPKADPLAGLTHLTQALERVNSPQSYRNALIELQEVRDLFDKALAKYRQDLPTCQQLAELYKRVAPAGTAQVFLARAAEDLARSLETKADLAAKTGDKQEPLVRAEARAQYLQAGEMYELAAQALTAQAQADTWYRSAQCYLPAQDFARAIRVLKWFVKTSNSDQKIAQAYIDLADAHRQLGQIEPATEAYLKCIGIPGTSLGARARYQLALIQIDQKKLKEAEDNLLHLFSNTFGAALDKETRELALFKLANLLFDKPDFEQSRLYLEQALQQHPLNQQVWRVRDQLGECYLHFAREAEGRWKSTKEIQWHGEQKKWLRKAIGAFQPLADELQKREGKSPKEVISPNEAAQLRRINLTLANLFFDLEDFPESLRRSRDQAQKNRRTQEGLEACKLLYRCVSALDMGVRPEEKARNREDLRLVLVNARQDINTMTDNDPAFQSTPRAQWHVILDTLSSYLANPGAVGVPN